MVRNTYGTSIPLLSNETKANLVQAQAEKEAGVEKMSKGQKRALETASLAEEQDQATVISSADGTKVLENLQKLEDNFQKFDKIVRISDGIKSCAALLRVLDNLHQFGSTCHQVEPNW